MNSKAGFAGFKKGQGFSSQASAISKTVFNGWETGSDFTPTLTGVSGLHPVDI